MDLIVINMVGTVITAFFLAMYIYVKIAVGQHQKSFFLLFVTFPIIIIAFTNLLSIDATGILSVSLSCSVYAAALDSIAMTLKTRDSKSVNMGITIASVINGLTWGTYAILVNDIYVLIPNVAAICSASIQLNLYKWTTGQIEHNHWLIVYL